MSDSPVHTVMWFRRDLRLSDNPALLEACDADAVLPLFVLDPSLWGPAGPSRRAYLAASLRSLDASLGRRGGTGLQVVRGKPERQVLLAAQAIGAQRVHVAADFGPYGRARDERVEKAATVPDPGLSAGLTLPEAGEPAARREWEAFLDRVEDYDEERDRPDLDSTSRMSHHLKYGEVHPRTLLADLQGRRGKGVATYRTELAWRDFYADVLARRPDSARDYYRPELARLEYDEPGAAFDAWREGRTGFPVVDAGMRQLRSIGWMHNRIRMVTASFLVKDLHVEWQHGARHFLHWLVDGDLASNNHGWQWTAGSGTDASPFFRVFNPTTQGRRFDPDGTYVRRWVPELRDLPDGADVHDPAPEVRERAGYPAPVVDHREERAEALERYGRIRT